LWSFSTLYLLGRTAVSAAVAEWYWRGGKIRSEGLFVKYVKKFFYHYIGTVAFGALIVPLVSIAKLIEFGLRPSFFKAQVMEEVKRDTTVDRIKQWFNRVLKIINYRVYNEIARHGGSFCESADIAEKMYNTASK
jgi:hypothetical protein